MFAISAFPLLFLIVQLLPLLFVFRPALKDRLLPAVADPQVVSASFLFLIFLAPSLF